VTADTPDPPAPEKRGSRRSDSEALNVPSGQFNARGATDEELLSRLALGRGHETALPELFERHGPRSLRLAARVLNDWQGAEEAVQDAFLRLADKAPLWRGECGFNTFFTRLLINVCRNRLRRGHDALAKGQVLGSPSQLLGGLAASSRLTEAGKKMQAEEVKQAVREALAQLPEKYREPLILRELEGYEYKEIALILDASLDEVRIWIYRGRQRLKELLAEREEDL
jgi:RNA polymerase sigma-70 factor (ECF subfamily)